MKKINEIIQLMAFSCLCLLGGCNEEETISPELPANSEISFNGMVTNPPHIITRAGDYFEDDYQYMTSDGEWGTIYIYDNVNSNNNSTSYQVRNGAKGRLETVSGNDALTWGNNLDVEHTFHAWTQPEAVKMSDVSNTGTVTFGTDLESSSNESNHSLDKFVGAYEPNITYGTQGTSVALHFKHLVCKISLHGCMQILSDGGTVMPKITDLKNASITFSNIPKTATFETNINGNDAPKITSFSEEKGVTFKMVNMPKDTSWYLLPFSLKEAGKFMIKIPYGGGNLTYHGDLADIGIEKLEAGEHLSLFLTLADGKVTGFGCYINSWDVIQGVIPTYSKPGIYTKEDLEDCFTNGNYNKYVDESNTIHIYNNLNFGNESLNIPNGVVVDGLGHNIKCGEFTNNGTVKDLFINGKGRFLLKTESRFKPGFGSCSFEFTQNCG